MVLKGTRIVTLVKRLYNRFLLHFFIYRTAEQNVDDLLFDMLKEKEDDKVVVGKFLAVSTPSAFQQD